MIKYLLLLLVLACSHKPQKNKEIAQLFESYSDEHASLFPLEATQHGDNRFNHVLPNDQTKEFRDKLTSFYQTYLMKLSKFDPAELTDEDRLSYRMFEYEMNIQLEGMRTNQWMLPVHQFWGLPLLMGQLGAGDQFQPFKTYEDYKNWLGRLQGFAAWTDSAIENMKEGMKQNVVLPTTLVLKTIPQMKDMASSDPTKSLFWGPMKKMPASFTKEQKAELTTAYKDAINTLVTPSYNKLSRFLEREYLPASRKSSGIDQIPGGAELYKYLVKYWTTTNLAPEQIYQVGLAEVERIQSEMEKVKEQVKFKGTLKEFFHYMRTDQKFTPFKTPQEVLAAFAKIHQTMQPKLMTMFGRTPKTPFEVRQTEKFREQSASAEYFQGSPDGSRPGIFYVPIINAKKFNITSGMESLFLHEAIPGHHYQISLQQENEGLPKFRRYSWYGAYGEGWALYTESLGKELGLYTDPYQYMGALGDEMHRAVRLVVDVAIHTKGMTREEAIKYMMDHQAIDKQGATAEIERYMAIPGQALSYKIGALKIAELRKRFKAPVSAFHDEILKDGCMPLSLIEEKMTTWAKKNKYE
jgi:uncharacterized protein (DUF885 family)